MHASKAAMQVKEESSKLIKPAYKGNPPSTNPYTPLSVFDKVSYNTHIAVIYAFKKPTPPNSTIEKGLSVALSEYRDWAGRLGENNEGNPVILLNDKGVRFIEASVESTLENFMPFKPSPALLNLHPSLSDVEELVQVQLTRFSCGSLVLGFTSHHLVADGHATSNFLLAWGLASRGLSINPLPFHDRSIFATRSPTGFDYEHQGVEYVTKKLTNIIRDDPVLKDDVIVHNVHFNKDFLSKLKSIASYGAPRPFTTFESLVAHLWRVVTKARGLPRDEMTQIRISVNGRMRMINPPVPKEYFGNLVLRAFPCATVKELRCNPLRSIAELIHNEILKVNNDYFQSFINFSSSKCITAEGLVPSADMNKSVLSPNLEVDSWLRFPFYDLDFGGGCPYYFMPTYLPVEGMLFLFPSFIGDGSIDAFIPLFQHNLKDFKKACYALE